jgi:DNA-binding NarL/FixJ family response regulator
MNNTKCLLVDDHPILRQGLRTLLAQHDNLTLVGEAATAALGLSLAQQLSPDVVVMDIHLPDMNGIEATRQLLGLLPNVKILVFSAEATRDFVDQALEAGASGYLSKTGALEELPQAIEWVMEGKLYLSPQVSAGILEDYRKGLHQISEPAKPVLSERDRQMLRLVAEGCRNKEIAHQLAISTKSVETYRSRLMKRLNYSSPAELVRFAIREGIVEA